MKTNQYYLDADALLRKAWTTCSSSLCLCHLISFVLCHHWCFFPSPLPAAASRWAQWWPWAGFAPKKRWTGASSGTSSWLGLWRCLWPACSAPPSWPCSYMASCPLSEGTLLGGRTEDEEEESQRKREREGKNLGENLHSSVRVTDKGKGRERGRRGEGDGNSEVYTWTWLYCGCVEGWFICCLAP